VDCIYKDCCKACLVPWSVCGRQGHACGQPASEKPAPPVPRDRTFDPGVDGSSIPKETELSERRKRLREQMEANVRAFAEDLQPPPPGPASNYEMQDPGEEQPAKANSGASAGPGASAESDKGHTSQNPENPQGAPGPKALSQSGSLAFQAPLGNQLDETQANRFAPLATESSPPAKRSKP
jgi:hypothetical protein